MVGEVKSDNGINIIGLGTHPSEGLRKGVVINIEATVNSIKSAIQEAELMAGCQISHVYTGIAGGHIQGLNSHGIVAVKDKEVQEGDITRVIDAARAIAIPMDREIIHILPQEYVIDGQDGIREPLGMSGVRLEAKVHVVTSSVTIAQNITKCAERCNLEVINIVLEQLASSESVLSQDEKELGVALIDIGGGTTDIAIWTDGSIIHTEVLSIGGDHITNDIAVGLRTPMSNAEKIKQTYGCALNSLLDSDEEIDVSSVGGRKPRTVKREILTEIIEPRVEEIFTLVQQAINSTGYEDLLASGVVLTGGATLLKGIPELAEDILGLPVRLGKPEKVGGLSDIATDPSYSTAVGLILYGQTHEINKYFNLNKDSMYKKINNQIKKFFGRFF